MKYALSANASRKSPSSMDAHSPEIILAERVAISF
jgi:hypothetical protein